MATFSFLGDCKVERGDPKQKFRNDWNMDQFGKNLVFLIAPLSHFLPNLTKSYC